MIRFGVLGSGRIGRVHARTLSLLRGANLVAVSDAVTAAADALAEDTGAEVRGTDEIVGANDIDAVVICTPTDTHADLIEAAARAGKPVFCEKPIDLDVGRVRACLATVATTPVPLMIGFQRRFDPDFRALKQALSEARIGKLEQIAITSRDPAPPPAEYIQRSGGIFRDMTIHDIDMARFLLERPIRRVLATGAALVDPGIGELGDFDTATLLLESVDDVQVVIVNSRRASYGYDQRVEVHGSSGALRVDNHHKFRLTSAGATGFTVPVLEDFFMTRYREAYAEEMRQFLHAVETGAPPPVTGQDGLEALIVADAAATSAAEGRWVEVPPV